MKFTFKVFYLTVLTMLMTSGLLLAQTEFSHGLIITDADAKTDTLIFGHSKAGTYCIDAALGEYELPPMEPEGIFSVRFVDNRTGAGACLGQGVPINFQMWTTAGIKDTFRVKFQPSKVGPSGAEIAQWPMTFSWPADVSSWYTALQMKITGDNPRTIDMLSQTSETIIEEDGVSVINIFATHIPNGITKEDGVLPTKFDLNQNYPNPFNPSTEFSFDILRASQTTIAIYDVLGRKIATLVSEDVTPGAYRATWNGT
ncbi:MAG: hypothetical protein HYZ34_03925, partial [Ignavibacteriae bacterium]|nr:hypothetical protein [Ignavibacteriota bacterium]